MIGDITPLILTHNEAPNIERTLACLGWAAKIVVIDSFSDDETLDIIAGYPQVEVYQRKFTTFSDQCNHGLEKITTRWVLSLDADYVLSPEFVDEIGRLDLSADISGFRVPFTTCVLGHALKGGLYPPRVLLYQVALAHYRQDGHAHRVFISGNIKSLESSVFHDDRKPFSRWLKSQETYAGQEVGKLAASSFGSLPLQDKLRMMVVLAPLAVAVYTLLVRGMAFQGWPGWYYAFQRIMAEILLSLKLMEMKLGELKDASII